MKRKGLSKGIDSIFKTNIKTDFEKVENIELEKIKPNTNQPRKSFDDDSLYELAESIEQNGILQPIILTKTKGGYQIVAGERRYRASQILRLKTIPSIIRDYDELEKSKLSIIENIQREDLNPLDETTAYKDLIDNYNLTQNDLSEAIGKSRSYIANMLRLLNLNDNIQELLRSNKLSTAHARTLVGMEDDKANKLAQRIIDEKLSVRDIERIVKFSKRSKIKKQKEEDIFLDDVTQRLTEEYGTNIKITNKSINIRYYDKEDLNRLIKKLL